MGTVILEKIHESILRHASLSKDVGLLNGKMGVALYAFEASRQYHQPELQKLAERLVCDVVEKLETTEITNNGFEDGLSGIVYGLEYFARERFILPEDENSFQNLNDRIFNAIIEHAENIPIDLSGIIGCLFYLYPKLSSDDLSSSELRYTKRLAIELINILSMKIDRVEKQFSEPLSFNILWNLPLILLSLGKMYRLHFYDQKIRHILEQLAPVILSLFPQIHANRLYLLLGMKMLNSLSILGWAEHVFLLEQNISMYRIVNEELKNRAIAIKNGISGVSLICDQLAILDSQNPFRIKHEELERKISESEYWSHQFEDNIGILYGNTGMGLALLKSNKNM